MKKIVVITGAASGIGKATADVLQSEYDLVLLDKAEISRQGKGIWVRQCDLLQTDQIAALWQDSEIPWEHLWGLVNCAGITVGGDIFDLTESEWDLDQAINLKAPFLMSQAAARHLQRNGGGSIVNISSLAGVQGAKKPNYAASKAGILGLTKAIAARAGQFGIRCNAIYPGAVDTPLIADWDEAKRLQIVGNTPLGRLARPEEIAQVVRFLLSEQASYITGAALNATGGQYLGQ